MPRVLAAVNGFWPTVRPQAAAHGGPDDSNGSPDTHCLVASSQRGRSALQWAGNSIVSLLDNRGVARFKRLDF